MRIYLGWDRREQDAFGVAARSACRFGNEVIGLYEDRLRAQGLLTRTVDHRGQMYDLVSEAPQATDFANSRFLVPMLAHSGWVLFADCDVVFLRDPDQLLDIVDPSKAVMVVKHQSLNVGGVKMDGQMQTKYYRKLWSSVMLINADHYAHKRLTLSMVNQWPGRDLHAFGWLHDDEIGELPPEWNWLVGITPKPKDPAIAHYTLGGPWLPDWEPHEHDEIWLEAFRTIRG